MKIMHRVLGMVETNCYLIINEERKESILIDPADEPLEIIKMIEESKSNLKAIFLTHGHFDHVMALETVAEKYQVSVYAHELEKEILENPDFNLSSRWMAPLSKSADCYLKDREKISLAGFEVEVIHTPGHTQGSVCYYFEKDKVLISGDTLFALSVGRCDYPTGNAGQLQKSIQGLFAKVPEQVKVYPGHMQETSIGYEMRYNPCV